MRSFLHSLVLILSLSLGLGACWVEPEQPYQRQSPPQSTDVPSSVHVAIATDETMEADPGEGAGVFVEYQAGGTWRIWTTCDTQITSTACHYQLSLQSEIGAVFSAPNEFTTGMSSDRLVASSGKSISATMTTTTETSALEVRMEPPGASLQLQATLDGSSDSRIIFWIGPDALHSGAPSNPVIFEPTTP